MSEALLGMVLDGLVLLFLGATIFFSVRLSVHLRLFRESRQDLEKLINDLTMQIGKAEKSIETLKSSARDISRELQQHLDEAKAVGNDLEIMTRGANNIADRLDRAADRNRNTNIEIPVPARKSKNERDEFPGFAIRDPDLSHQEQDESADAGGSLAERELLEALQSRKGR
ncbi:MAG: hypothetical protein HYS17_10240 [Micavibrio aeruginosavorus]|uniref:DUF6468 domain-containing protein n=1 Tax=Micavibrio aeruginosavorus TaxID=349221 RepID=A0A7T5R1P0_9BACT|nr:MAG: hypothetical protein HYS17_10240 [Micavibrio aeruginosavorus]